MSEFGDLTLFIGNKNYSSWSLRAWLPLKRLGLRFDEVTIPLRQEATQEAIRRWSPSGMVPCLKHGDLVVWDSLAICEYLAELKPDAGLWPRDRAGRAHARSVAAEMHSGFQALRRHIPMNVRRRVPSYALSAEVREQVERIQRLWSDCAAWKEEDGPFLFGRFTIADAMYAPVASRFVTYHVDLRPDALAYVAAIMATPEMQEWAVGAEKEPWMAPDYEVEG